MREPESQIEIRKLLLEVYVRNGIENEDCDLAMILKKLSRQATIPVRKYSSDHF